MRDGRSLRDPHFFACFITTAFPKLRALPQSPTATAPSRREPFSKHILPLSLVYFSSPAIASFEPRSSGVVFASQKRQSPQKRELCLYAFLREEGGTRMRDGRSLRDPHFFACFITTAFPKLRALPQSPTATAPSRREP